MSQSWRHRRRALIRPVIATTPVRRVATTPVTAAPAGVTWPTQPARPGRDTQPLELEALLAGFVRTFARADAEIARSSRGVVMVLDGSSIEIATRWLGDDEGRFMLSL